MIRMLKMLEFFLNTSEFILPKQYIQTACLTLKVYSIRPVSNWKLKLTEWGKTDINPIFLHPTKINLKAHSQVWDNFWQTKAL